ncbi:MAG TPA: arginase family protein, partial [Polyangiaceae bacterium]|nr:arginase family protein [Polyangiaceae bacterium]
PEPDGLQLVELRSLLRKLLRGRTVLGADLVEVQPDALANSTARAALQVAFELLDLLQPRASA